MTSPASNGRITVVIPLYNKAPYIGRCLASVAAQTLAPHEVLVVDDGSTDGGAGIVRGLAMPGLRVIHQANAGVSAARNAGIAAAQGDLVAFLDADDAYRPGFLATVAGLAQRFPRALMYCTGYAQVDALGQRHVMRLSSWPVDARGLLSDFHRNWSRKGFTITSVIAVRRSALQSMPQPFPVGERLGEDQDLWLRLAETGDVAYANSDLGDYHVEVAGSATQGAPLVDVLPCYQRLSQRLEAGQVPTPLRAGARRLLASHLLNVANARRAQGDGQGARQLLWDRRAAAQPLYWLRSAWRICTGGRG